MRFVKLRLNPKNGKPSEEWRAVVSTLDDLYKWANFEGHLISRAFMQLEKTFDGTRFDAAHIGDKRTSALATMLNVRAERLAEGETMSPIVATAEIHSKKISTMERMILAGDEVCINTAGGFCDLAGFLEIWHGEIIETVEKDDQGFPVEEAAKTAATIIIENQDKVNSKFIKIVEDATETKAEFIFNLKEKDQRWVLQSIFNAKTVAMVSTFGDREQLTEFLTAFLALPSKRVIIGYYGDKEIEVLKTHSLYGPASKKHSIELIKL